MTDLPRWKPTITDNDLHKDCYPQWIRVEDGLPADDEFVIAYFPCGIVDIGYCDADGEIVSGQFGAATHWIPIPSPPPSVRIEQ